MRSNAVSVALDCGLPNWIENRLRHGDFNASGNNEMDKKTKTDGGAVLGRAHHRPDHIDHRR